MLSPLFVDLARALLQCTERPDADQRNLRCSAYEVCKAVKTTVNTDLVLAHPPSPTPTPSSPTPAHPARTKCEGRCVPVPGTYPSPRPPAYPPPKLATQRNRHPHQALNTTLTNAAEDTKGHIEQLLPVIAERLEASFRMQARVWELGCGSGDRRGSGRDCPRR